jgi:hypothetical protein
MRPIAQCHGWCACLRCRRREEEGTNQWGRASAGTPVYTSCSGDLMNSGLLESGSGWPPGSGSAGAADTNVHCPLAPRAAVGNGTVVGRGARRNRGAAVGLAVFCFCQSQVTVSVVRPVPAAHELNDLRAGEARGLVRSAFARGSCEVLFLSTGSQVELLLREVPKIS